MATAAAAAVESATAAPAGKQKDSRVVDKAVNGIISDHLTPCSYVFLCWFVLVVSVYWNLFVGLAIVKLMQKVEHVCSVNCLVCVFVFCLLVCLFCLIVLLQ